MRKSRGCFKCVGAFTLLIAILMVVSWFRDPWIADYEGTLAYGHNGPNDLLRGLGGILLQGIVVIGVLRPWNYEFSWLRPLAAAVLLLPWLGLLFITAMHAGDIHAWYLVWTAVLVVWLGRLTVRDRQAEREELNLEVVGRHGV